MRTLPILLIACAALAQPAKIVTDLNTTPTGGSSFPNYLVQVNGITYFAAYDAPNGGELWRTDGTAAGTSLVKDIAPGVTSSQPENLTKLGAKFLFSAYVPNLGRELWVSDGTAQGTLPLKDIRAGSASSNPGEFVEINGVVYFIACEDSAGCEIWRTDGTTAGTWLLKDITPGPAGSLPAFLTAVNGTLFFQASSGFNNPRLWKSDGTPGGTVMVTGQTEADPYAPSYLVNVNGVLYFSGYASVGGRGAGSFGYELWKSDGTTGGTVLVKAIQPIGGSNPANLAAFNGQVYFSADDGVRGPELWKSDGTAAGTVPVVAPALPAAAYPRQLTASGAQLFFVATNAAAGDELWRTDGTAAGTVMTKDIAPGPASSSPFSITPFNGGVIFSATDNVDSGRGGPVTGSGIEVWKSDGTPEGTMRVRDIEPGAESSYPGNYLVTGGQVIFRAVTTAYGAELWRTDGSEAGTWMLKDICNSSGSSTPDNLVSYNGFLYFTAATPQYGRELWRTDGTAAGTTLVKDFCPGSCSSHFPLILVVNGKLIVNAYTPSTGYEIFVSDGTGPGTTLLKDINPGPGNGAILGGMIGYSAVSNGVIYFPGLGDPATRGLWRTDGTAAGTYLVKAVGRANQMTTVGNTIFFVAADVGTNNEIWKSDGTAAGTQKVIEINPNGGSFPIWLVDFKGKLYFAAYDGTDQELYVSDGTAPGTYKFKDICPGTCSSLPGGLVAGKDRLWFSANDGSHGFELWSTDGTQQGTVLVADARPGAESSYPSQLTVQGDSLYFFTDGGSGWELWMAKESSVSAALVRDFNGDLSSSVDSYENSLFDAGHTMLMAAADASSGLELWRSGGTAQSTFLMQDIAGGPGSSSPAKFAQHGKDIFFVADDGIRGRELWVMPAFAQNVAGPALPKVNQHANGKDNAPGQQKDSAHSGPSARMKYGALAPALQ
ncbi:MAG: hypothetical protein HYX27_14710 [Acidobacteria bacterium]|nr:hypothetical protein [Acidobacteriota bacterium]